MDPFQSRLVPRLVLDTISSLWLAHDSLQEQGKDETRQAITALRNADLTDTEAAALFLLDLAHHLREIESRLEAADRPYVARKLRRVLDRVSYLE
jgi:hypothetical protein